MVGCCNCGWWWLCGGFRGRSSGCVWVVCGCLFYWIYYFIVLFILF